MIPHGSNKFLVVVVIAILCQLMISANCYADASAYIANSSDDIVSVIKVTDNTDNSDISSISVGGNPYGVAADLNGDYVYVSNSSDNTVSVITILYNTVIKTFNVGTIPRGMAVTPDGAYVYVANNGENTVSAINISNDQIGLIPVGSEPLGVVMSPDGKYVYVSNYSDNTISVITREDNTVLATINNDISDDEVVFDGPFGVAISLTGYYVYVVNNVSSTLSIIYTGNFYDDDEDDEYEYYSSVDVGNDPRGICIATTEDTTYAYVSNYSDGTVSVIDLEDFSVSEISVGNGPFGISGTLDSAYVFVVNSLDGTVSVIDTADNSVINTITVGNLPVSFGNFIGGKPPNAPSNLEATLADDATISLSWTDNSDDELGFKIKRKRYNDGTYSVIATVDANVTSYEDSGLGENSNYYYQVCAYSHAGYSEYSDEDYATTDEEDDSGCFIATAAYGSPMEPQVMLLREFRDRFMITNLMGKTFLNLYYEYSPPVAHFISDHEILRFLIRWSLVPIVGTAWLFMTLGFKPALVLIALFLSIISAVIVTFFKQKGIRTGTHCLQ